MIWPLENKVMSCFEMENFWALIFNRLKVREVAEQLRSRYKIFSESESPNILGERAGLMNSGNFCYLNSVLQALFMTKGFCDALLMKDLSDKPILEGLQKLFAQMTIFHCSVVSSEDMWKLVQPRRFNKGQQHDSSEYLITLFQMLREEEDDEVVPNFLGIVKYDPMALSMKMYKPVVQNREKFLRNVFGGAMDVQVICTKCKSETFHRDYFTEWQVCLPKRNVFSLASWSPSVELKYLVRKFLGPEKLTGKNQYFCNVCQIYQDAIRTQTVIEDPKCLILIVNRFKYVASAERQIKQMRIVNYADTLDIVVESESRKIIQYKFYAAVVHAGHSVESGHYYTISRDADDNWVKMDDDQITSITFDKVKNLEAPETPYILFYCANSESLKPAVKSTEHISLTDMNPTLISSVLNGCIPLPQEIFKEKPSHFGIYDIKKRVCKQILETDCLPHRLKEYAYDAYTGFN